MPHSPPRRPTLLAPLSLALALGLAACASKEQKQVVDAVATPLSDLHLVHADIPAVLQQAQKQPYAMPDNQSCEALAAEVLKFDEVLGPDLDAPPGAASGLIERGSNMANDAAVGALRRTAEGVVPFRGWVRKLSGAERYSHQVAAAIAAGTVQRAFLKGIKASQHCA